jgi:hypothetical protein
MWVEIPAALEPVLTAFGGLVATGATLSAIVFGLFRFFGERWLASKFEERLEAFRHAQQKELEQLRFRINALMDRTVKLHQKEFEVVPEAWGRLIEAYNAVKVFTSPFQSYPNVNQMNDEQLEEFLSDAPLENWQKSELRASSDKVAYYMKAVFHHRLAGCRDACRDHHVYVLKNGIFMPPEIRSKFNEIEDLIPAVANADSYGVPKAGEV